MKIATGRKRYRVHKGWFGGTLVVLQLEYTITGRVRYSNDGGRCESEDLPDSIEWQDARPEDIMTFEGDK